MFTWQHAAIRRLLALAMLAASLGMIAPMGATAQSDRGLIDATSYQSPQFGYTVTWAEPWTVQDRDVITNPGGFDTITLRSDAGTMRVSGRADTYNPLTFMQDTIAIQLASGGEVINQDTTGAVPTAELQLGADRMRLDVVSIPSAGAIVLVSLRAPQDQYATALDTARNTVALNDTAAFSESPTEPAATTAATEEPVPTSTVEVRGSGTEGNTYTSPNFGFSISWDPAAWNVPDEAEYSEPGSDSLRIESDTGPLFVTGWRAYDGDPASCLLGEQTYYNDPEAGVSDYEVGVDADGNELTGSDDTSAWGVYTNTYTDPEDPAAAPVHYVDYIRCVSMGDGESVVIFYSFSPREAYNDHISTVLDVVDTLELPTVTALPPTPTEIAPPPSPTETAPLPTTPPTPSPIAETPSPSPTTSGQSVIVGQTELGWTSDWQYDESSSTDQQASLAQIDAVSGNLKLATYGEFQDESVGSQSEALDAFTSAFFDGAGATSVLETGSGELDNGALWKIFTFDLQGLQLTLLATVSEGSDGAYIVSTLTGNTDQFTATIEAAQQDITLNGEPTYLDGIDAATVLAPGATAPPTDATATPAQTPSPGPAGTPPDIAGGDDVTGQTHAWSFTVPAGWTVTSSEQGGQIERTELTNGTSTVSIEARAMQAPTLSDCVVNIAGEQTTQAVYTDLELARTSNGDPFSGEDGSSAFANFTFTGPDGEVWSHFVECRWIEPGQSVLVVVQDVAQAQFGAERAGRRQIQNSIEVGS